MKRVMLVGMCMLGMSCTTPSVRKQEIPFPSATKTFSCQKHEQGITLRRSDESVHFPILDTLAASCEGNILMVARKMGIFVYHAPEVFVAASVQMNDVPMGIGRPYALDGAILVGTSGIIIEKTGQVSMVLFDQDIYSLPFGTLPYFLHATRFEPAPGGVHIIYQTTFGRGETAFLDTIQGILRTREFVAQH